MENKMDKMSCAELVRLFLAGTCNAFGVLYNRYSNFILNNCRKWVKNEMIALELMQETFRRVAGILHNFRPKEGEKSFRKLVWIIAFHLFIDYIRHSGKEEEAIKTALDIGNIGASRVPDPSKNAQINEQKELLWKAINELPELSRICINNHHFTNIPPGDTCKTYNMTKSQYYYWLKIGEQIITDKMRNMM